MNQIRKEQIIAALEWAEDHYPTRCANAETDNLIPGRKIKLYIGERRDGVLYLAEVKEGAGTDFSAMIDAKEREDDEKLLARLQAKHGGKDEVPH